VFRYLRIAVSVVSLTACVLLILLWVRSYYRRDLLAGHVSALSFVVESADGNVAIWSDLRRPGFRNPWGIGSYGPHSQGFGQRIDHQFFVRHGSLLLLLAFIAAIPWLNLIPWKPRPRQ